MAAFDRPLTRRTLIAGGALATGALATASFALTRTSDNGPASFDVRAFGARGDGLTDDSPAIQRAIDAAHAAGGGTVSVPRGTYLLRHRDSPDGDGLAAIVLRSGVTLEGLSREHSILRLADTQLGGPGTFARILSSVGEISGATVRNLTLDGNRAGQGSMRDNTNGSIIQLGWKGRCTNVTVEDVTAHGANGQAIMLIGTIGAVSRNLRIARNHVRDCSFIGIQSSQFEGLVIEDNLVHDCGDNGIDVYGDDTTGRSPVSTSGAGLIRNNRVERCRLGIFLESVARIRAAGNVLRDCSEAGFRVNRIHGEPREIVIEDNEVVRCGRGVAVGGDTGGVAISGNRFLGFTFAGLDFGYNVSNVTATNNRFVPATPDTPIIFGTPTGNSGRNGQPKELLSHIRIQGNQIVGPHREQRRFVNRYERNIDVDVGGFTAVAR